MKGSRGPSCKKVRQDALNLPELAANLSWQLVKKKKKKKNIILEVQLSEKKKRRELCVNQ